MRNVGWITPTVGSGLLLTLCHVAASSAPATTRNPETVNSLGMRLIHVAPGQFHMGNNTGGDFDERPAHAVTLRRPFRISATEVTNAQYEQFDPTHRAWRGKHGSTSGDDEPVVFVSWHDAMRFCRWLSQKEGKPYRLPTEAEWEYACRAGTTTAFSTGETLPKDLHKRQETVDDPTPVPSRVAQTPANAWSLFDMHGNVEEWCYDWYGPYPAGAQTDPVGRRRGDFRVTRGGSHSTPVEFLRSANRMGTLPEDKHWLLGFRVVQAELPSTKALPAPEPEPWARNVSQKQFDWKKHGPDPNHPYFQGPQVYVKIPAGSDGPLFSRHNHCPAITALPNGDLMAIWYSCRTEPGRELTVVASRLRRGASEWEPAAPFWDAPDRNDHGNAIWWDGKNTLYHFNGLCSDGTWSRLALVLRTSTDNGVTWSKARIVEPNHGYQNQVISGMFCTLRGTLVLPCDAVPGGNGGTVVHVSRDAGKTWEHPASGRPTPQFAPGNRGAWIAGIHAGVVDLKDGRWLALGRGDTLNGRMPMSLSDDEGKTWTYQPSAFPPISSGQRLVLMRLREGPLLFISFTDPRNAKPNGRKGLTVKDAAGKPRQVYGMYAALSYDEGKTWPVRKLITPGGPPRTYNGGAWTQEFTLDDTHAEHAGYLHATQSPDGVIQLISSALHYRFNLKWLETPMPTGNTSGPTKP